MHPQLSVLLAAERAADLHAAARRAGRAGAPRHAAPTPARRQPRLVARVPVAFGAVR